MKLTAFMTTTIEKTVSVKLTQLDPTINPPIGSEKICGVLMLTAFSQREVVEEARDAGALAYLVKPYQVSQLVEVITELSQQGANRAGPSARPRPPVAFGDSCT